MKKMFLFPLMITMLSCQNLKDYTSADTVKPNQVWVDTVKTNQVWVDTVGDTKNPFEKFSIKEKYVLSVKNGHVKYYCIEGKDTIISSTKEHLFKFESALYKK